MATIQTALQSPSVVSDLLHEQGYICDDNIATTVYLCDALGKPLLVEGPAGVGKTELAKVLARILDVGLIRLQCYEGLDESRALYEWNYKRQLLRIQADTGSGKRSSEEEIFTDEFLLERPLLQAIRSKDPVLLLVDEVDRLDLEAEALLLEVLSDWQISIPELGTIGATTRPWVVLTSNATRELSEALKRRCLFLHLGYPTIQREQEILISRLPGIEESFARQVSEAVRSIRLLDLKKPPSISESIDWARSLVALCGEQFSEAEAARSIGVLLKHPSDIDKALKALGPAV